MPKAKRITINDIRAQGYCVRGVKDWFERHDLDFKLFLNEGITEKKFLASGDDIAVQIVKRKQEATDRG